MQIATQSALVAGGGSGIGAAVARHLAGLGAKVAVLDVNPDGAKATAQEIGGIAIECDIASASSAEKAIAAARDAHGPARILVNCAGILSPGRILGKDGPLSLDIFRRVIEVNLIGAFNLLRLAAADMAKLRAAGRRRARCRHQHRLRSPPTKARSARSPMRPRRPAWRA